MFALSLLCSLPVNVVERAVTDSKGETLLILAKALRFSWDTAMALLFLGAQGSRISEQNLDRLRMNFEQFKLETAGRVLESYQMRGSETDAAPRRGGQL